MLNEERPKIILRNSDMFVWMSVFQNPLAHTHFNMFVDEWTNANESPDKPTRVHSKRQRWCFFWSFQNPFEFWY